MEAGSFLASVCFLSPRAAVCSSSMSNPEPPPHAKQPPFPFLNVAAPTPNPQTIQLQLGAENGCGRGSICTHAPLP